MKKNKIASSKYTTIQCMFSNILYISRVYALLNKKIKYYTTVHYDTVPFGKCLARCMHIIFGIGGGVSMIRALKQLRITTWACVIAGCDDHFLLARLEHGQAAYMLERVHICGQS